MRQSESLNGSKSLDMGEETVNRIWRPNVELLGASPLQAGNENRLAVAANATICYTKTSLKHDHERDEVHTLNRRIHEASQAHNSTAKPFAKQTSLVSAPLYQDPVQFEPEHVETVRGLVGPQTHQSLADHSQHHQFQQQQQHHPDHHHQRQSEGATMNPQLVHKQYNSPIEMYSMNNIRKTIEAQSELLAPGVKGINFMKSESPVNKQSEVYKLIKEEEEAAAQRRKLAGSATSSNQIYRQVSPTRGPSHDIPSVLISVAQPNSLPASGEHQQERVHYASERTSSQSTTHQSTASSSRGTNQSPRSLAQAIQQSMPAAGGNRHLDESNQSTTSAHAGRGQPKCSECGQFIVGPFARVQDRQVHPHCFNCSTCGSSLKNSGYFTINEKLYCDIHARQVANVMRLNYNFEPNKQTIDNTRQQYDLAAAAAASAHGHETHQQQVAVKHQTSAQPPATQARHDSNDQYSMPKPAVGESQRCANCCVTLKNQSATISTMFSNRADGGCTCGRRSEISWIWRPCQAQKQHELGTVSDNSIGSSTTNVASSRHQHQQQFEHHERHEQRQQQIMRNKYESRLMSAPADGGAARLPVCCHCNIQIHGPYILAGKTIWCKPCSQTNFVCGSCHRSLLNVGFIEDNQVRNKYYCEHCFEIYLAPVCAKCHIRIKDQDCLKALGKTWHPNCFVCAYCKCQFGNSSFYLEDDLPYCERDWNSLFTTKCHSCNYPIEAGDKWIEALERNYHSDCFRCTGCQVKLEGSTFYCKGGKPYCRMHAR